MDIAVSTQHLTKVYKNKAVVRDADIQVNRGQVYGLVGRNGAGKTTILRMLCGCALPDQGTISLFGAVEEKGLLMERRRIGSVLESPSFYPYFTAKQNLEYYRTIRGIPEDQSAEEALAIVGLTNTGNKKFKNFSMGMKQKLGLALAIMGNPDLLILDEPTNGLDPMGIVEFRQIVARLNQEKGITMIISSHILGELSRIATHYGFIENGRIIEEVSAEEIHQRCRKSIAFTVDDGAKAAAVLEQSLSIQDYEVLNGNQLRVYQSIDTPHLITRALVNADIAVMSVVPQESNLENYYVELVGGGKDA